ncbi:MAG: hypothetical protein RL538_719 [Candidatus Parcubacteria bacterium]|jgi:hypothetical protein
MSHGNTRHSSGLIDESLDYVLTSLRIRESYIGQSPAWLRAEAHQLRNPVPRIDRIFDLINGKTETRAFQDTEQEARDENPEFFIGTKDSYIQNTAAPKLAWQLAEAGLIPKKRKLIFRGWSERSRIFDLNIYWNHRNRWDDSEVSALFIEETASLFFDWQVRFGWSVKGIEFLTDVRMINLVFTGRHRLLPSERWHEVVLEADIPTGAPRLVVT